MLKIITLNLNGIRAAARKGFLPWLRAAAPDIICVQELKAQQKDMPAELLRAGGMRGVFSYAARPGYSGVGIYASAAKRAPLAARTRFGDAVIDGEGRYARLDFPGYSVISLYMPSGSSGEARQQVKYALMKKIAARLARFMRDHKKSGREYIICADWNIAHTEKDLRNWRGNRNNSGFLPQERQWLSSLLAAGWADVFRQLNANDGEYTWWSNRGRAWENNTGWRIDYQLTTPGIARRAAAASIYKKQRFSDHAPLTICYHAD